MHSPCWFLDIKFKEYSKSIQELKTEFQGVFEEFLHYVSKCFYWSNSHFQKSSTGYKMHFKRHATTNTCRTYQICNNSSTGMHNNFIVLGGYKMLGYSTWKEDLNTVVIQLSNITPNSNVRNTEFHPACNSTGFTKSVPAILKSVLNP